MSDQFVPYHMMQFQKLKHVVTRYFDTKSSEKSKQIQRQPGAFIQMQICFLTKRKKKIGKYTAKLTFPWYDDFGKKERSLHKNGILPFQKRCSVAQPCLAGRTAVILPNL